MGGEAFDLDRGAMLFRDVARGAPQADDPAVVVVRNACIDPDPAVAAVARDEVGEVIFHLAVAAQRGEEAPVGNMRRPRLEIEEAAADQVPLLQVENVDAAVVQVSEAAERIGGPDQVVRGLHQVAVTRLAFQQQLDDAAFFLEGAAGGGKLVFVLSRPGVVGAGPVRRGAFGGIGRRAGESVDDFMRVAAVAAGSAASDQHALGVPAAQFLHRDAELGRRLLNRVFGQVLRHDSLEPPLLPVSRAGRNALPAHQCNCIAAPDSL